MAQTDSTAINRRFNAKLMFVLNDGTVWFAGHDRLVEGPEQDVRYFTDIDAALDRIRDVVMLNLVGVSQVRMIGAAFAQGEVPSP